MPPFLGDPTAPRHQIVTARIRALGMEFGGAPLLKSTIAELVASQLLTTLRCGLPKWQSHVRVYRHDPKAGGHHKTAFDALPLSLGPGGKTLADYFEISRRKRNEIDYDRAFIASEADADEIVLCARELHAFVEDWIATGHPRLAKNRREARCTLRCVVARKRHTSRSR